MTDQQKVRDKRKEVKMQEINKKRQDKTANMPMNKYINDGNYSMSKKVEKYLWDNFDPVRDVMRQIQSLVHQIRHLKIVINNYKVQYESGEIKEKNKYGNIMSKEELFSQLIVEQVNVPRTLSDIRRRLLDTMLPMIDDAFTPELYDKFAASVEKALDKLDETLFPDKIELLEII